MSFWDYIAPIAGSFLGGATGLPAGSAFGSAVGSGLSTGLKTGNPLAGAAAAAGSGIGSYLGSQFGGSYLNNAGSSTNAASGGQTGGPLSSSPSNALSGVSDFGSQSYGDLLAGGIGGAVGGQMASSLVPAQSASTDPAPFKPSRAASMALPGSLAQYGGLSPDQELSGIATKGVYGGGNSPDENKYFLNLINNRLVDQGGNVGNESMNPIENSYLSQLGLGGYGNNTDLLKGIQNYAG